MKSMLGHKDYLKKSQIFLSQSKLKKLSARIYGLKKDEIYKSSTKIFIYWRKFREEHSKHRVLQQEEKGQRENQQSHVGHQL